MTPTISNKSWLPPSKGNKFQRIKARTKAAQDAGKKIFRLSIGQPLGPALLSARKAAAEAVMSGEESMHEYQDNGSSGVPDFAKRFSQCHVLADLSAIPSDEIAYLPVPGIKPMLPLIPLACAASSTHKIRVLTMTDPGYPTPGYWAGILPGVEHTQITFNPGSDFLVKITDLLSVGHGDLLMLNYPHNPSGKVADEGFWDELCSYCEAQGIRIWNDAAYAVLDHGNNHCSLADVALKYRGLSWAEGYSASKAGNFTGWRIGSIVGSADFVGDIARIKGDADSGFAAPMAAGIIFAFEHDRASIEDVRKVYAKRISILCDTLIGLGMKLAVKPEAGFFTLWLTPKRAFGVDVLNAEHFGDLLIENTGIVGVDFDPYMRFAVTGDIEAMFPDIFAGFKSANVSY